MKYPVYNQQGERLGETLLPKEIFEVELNSDLLHQVVVSQMANRRQGTVHTKTRGEVRGGGKKPWRQKGTGRARAGSIRSPLWRGGGTVFGPRKEKIYRQKINKKMRRKALLMVLSAKARDKELLVLDDFQLQKAKTKEASKIIEDLRMKIADLKKGSILFVLPQREEKIIRAGRNIPGLTTIEVRNLNTLDLLSYQNLLLTKETISGLKKMFKAEA